MEPSLLLRRLIVDSSRLLLRRLRYSMCDPKLNCRNISERANHCGTRIFASVVNDYHRVDCTRRNHHEDVHCYDRRVNDGIDNAEGKRNNDDDIANGKENSLPLRSSSRVETMHMKIDTKLRIEFTCTKCGVRNEKYFSKSAYTKGVVIIRCDGCQNNHLIADNLNWFGENAFRVTSSSSQDNVNEPLK